MGAFEEAVKLRRYCEMCDEWTPSRQCRKCGAPTVPAETLKVIPSRPSNDDAGHWRQHKE
jgi:hypothetical protein